MRPVRAITAVMFAAAIAITGCAAHSAVEPSPAPSPPVVDRPALPVTDSSAPKPTPTPRIAIDRVPAPVLADGRYDAYIRRVQVPIDYGTSQLVVDLVQVFQGQAAVDAAIADGMSHDQAQVLGVYVRTRTRACGPCRWRATCAWTFAAATVRRPTNHQLAKLMDDARSMSGSVHTYYFTLTVTGGAVDRVQEFLAINAC